MTGDAEDRLIELLSLLDDADPELRAWQLDARSLISEWRRLKPILFKLQRSYDLAEVREAAEEAIKRGNEYFDRLLELQPDSPRPGDIGFAHGRAFVAVEHLLDYLTDSDS